MALSQICARKVRVIDVCFLCAVVALLWTGVRYALERGDDGGEQGGTFALTAAELGDARLGGISRGSHSLGASVPSNGGASGDDVSFHDLVRHQSNLFPSRVRSNLRSWWSTARQGPLGVLMVHLEEDDVLWEGEGSGIEAQLVSLASMYPVIEVTVLTRSASVREAAESLRLRVQSPENAGGGSLSLALKGELAYRRKNGGRSKEPVFFGVLTGRATIPDGGALVSTLYGVAADIQERRVPPSVVMVGKAREASDFADAIRSVAAISREERRSRAWEHARGELDERMYALEDECVMAWMTVKGVEDVVVGEAVDGLSVSGVVESVSKGWMRLQDDDEVHAPLIDVTATLPVLSWADVPPSSFLPSSAGLETVESTDGHITTALRGSALDTYLDRVAASGTAASALNSGGRTQQQEHHAIDDDEWEECDDDGEGCIPWGVDVSGLEEAAGKPLIAVFTTFISKDTNNLEGLQKHLIQLNMMRAMKFLGPRVTGVVFSEDPVIAKLGKEEGVIVTDEFKVNPHGTPYLKSMYAWIERETDAPVYGYANGDILFTSDLIETVEAVLHGVADGKLHERVLIVGRRTNFHMPFPLEEDNEWILRHPDDADNVIHSMALRGDLFQEDAEDFFFITRNAFHWDKIPDFVVGRVAYDNWLVDHAYHDGLDRVDATNTLTAVHETGVDGNKAGHRPKPDYSWNEKLGRGNWDHGQTSHCNFATKRDQAGNIVLIDRQKFHMNAAKSNRIKRDETNSATWLSTWFGWKNPN